MSEMFGAYVGEPVWKQSLRFAWMEECCGGGMISSVSCFKYVSTLLTAIRRDVCGVELLRDTPTRCKACLGWCEDPAGKESDRGFYTRSQKPWVESILDNGGRGGIPL